MLSGPSLSPGKRGAAGCQWRQAVAVTLGADFSPRDGGFKARQINGVGGGGEGDDRFSSEQYLQEFPTFHHFGGVFRGFDVTLFWYRFR